MCLSQDMTACTLLTEPHSTHYGNCFKQHRQPPHRSAMLAVGGRTLIISETLPNCSGQVTPLDSALLIMVSLPVRECSFPQPFSQKCFFKTSMVDTRMTIK